MYNTVELTYLYFVELHICISCIINWYKTGFLSNLSASLHLYSSLLLTLRYFPTYSTSFQCVHTHTVTHFIGIVCNFNTFLVLVLFEISTRLVASRFFTNILKKKGISKINGKKHRKIAQKNNIHIESIKNVWVNKD